MFSGYPFGKESWRVYDIEKNEFLVSHDVVFKEDEFPYASMTRECIEGQSQSIPMGANDENWIVGPSTILDKRGSHDDAGMRPKTMEAIDVVVGSDSLVHQWSAVARVCEVISVEPIVSGEEAIVQDNLTILVEEI